MTPSNENIKVWRLIFAFKEIDDWKMGWVDCHNNFEIKGSSE
jgi:hypothetical protein